MPFVHQAEQPPELLEALGVEILEREVLQQSRVSWLFRRVREHATDVVVTAAVVAFMQTAVGVAERIRAQVHRASTPFRARHADDDQLAAIYLLGMNVARAQQVDAHLVAIVQAIPQVLLIALQLVQAQSVENDGAVDLAGAEHDRPTLGVGHRRVGLPEAARQATLRGLELPVGAFTDLGSLQDLFARDGHGQTVLNLSAPLLPKSFEASASNCSARVSSCAKNLA